MKRKKLLFGAAYYDEYMPYDRIDEDMRLMKEAGMNVIRIAESTWSTWEPSDGVYDFTHLHRMLDAASRYDMQVIIGTPTYAIPAWLSKKYPKILSFSKNGQELYGHRQLTDITNPDYLYHAERIIRKLMEQVSDHPQVIGYQLDNETRSAGAASPETQALFVNKMKEKYPDIEDFNREFGLDYWSNRIASWEDFPDVRGTINGSLSAAYKRFLRDCITDFLCWQSDILREYMKPEQFITHNFDYSWIGHSFGIQPEVNQYEAAAAVDIAGVDIYHPSQSRLTGAEIAFGGAVGRSLKKDNYLVLETQSQGRLNWLPYPGQLRLQAYSHLASGANSVMYWNWHSIHNSFESYWKGILSHNLKPNASYNELKDFGFEVHTIENHLLNLKKDCKAAIITDNASLTGLDEFPINEETNALDYNHILRHIYDTCYRMNLECDMVSTQDNFSPYKLLIVPALYAATTETIAKLTDYVSQGGHLLMTYKSCFSDEELKIYHGDQPYGMTECIGATYDQFTAPEKNTSIRWAETFPAVTNENKPDSYSISDWMELITPVTADVWAYYEHPYWKNYAAVTHNSYGSGTATYIGCHMDVSALEQILRRICSIADIETSENTFPVITKTGTNDANHKLTYLFNYSSEKTVALYEGPDGKDLLTGVSYTTGSNIELAPWNLVMIEEE